MESWPECAVVLRGHPLEFEVRERNVLSGFESISSILRTEASVLIDLTTKAAQEFVVESSSAVGLVLLEKRAKTECAIAPRGHPLEKKAVSYQCYMLEAQIGFFTIGVSCGTHLWQNGLVTIMTGYNCGRRVLPESPTLCLC